MASIVLLLFVSLTIAQQQRLFKGIAIASSVDAADDNALNKLERRLELQEMRIRHLEKALLDGRYNIFIYFDIQNE